MLGSDTVGSDPVPGRPGSWGTPGTPGTAGNFGVLAPAPEDPPPTALETPLSTLFKGGDEVVCAAGDDPPAVALECGPDAATLPPVPPAPEPEPDVVVPPALTPGVVLDPVFAAPGTAVPSPVAFESAAVAACEPAPRARSP